MDLRKLATEALIESKKDQALDAILAILNEGKLTFNSAEDEDVNSPKNETLAEHRKHCEAKPGNCPFEKKLAKEDEADLLLGGNGNDDIGKRDADYAAAVARGDREMALRMIIETAKMKYGDDLVVDENGDPVEFYRGDTTHRNVFDPTKDKNGFGDVYFTDNKEYAEKFGPAVDAVILVVKNPSVHDFGKEGFSNALMSRYDNHDAAFVYGVMDFTGIRHGEVLMRKMNNIKSADITYDDNGKLIPLSKRFDSTSVDIRDEANVRIRRYFRQFSAAEDELPTSLGKHDRRFHGGRFDPETMTCKLREDLAKTDDPDAMIAKHEAEMSAISHKKADEYLRLMKKKCPQLDPEQTLTEITAINDRKIQGDAFRWLMKGAVKLPEDLYKIRDARQLADKAKRDPFSYDTPQAAINDLQGLFKRGAESNVKPIDPDTVPELSDKRVLPMGVTTYLVQDDQHGQQAMRRIINTHWGKDANPWCLLHGDGQGYLSDGSDGGYDAWHYWNHYNALPKRVAFKDGKLLAFMATDGNLDLVRDSEGRVDTMNSSEMGLHQIYPDESDEYDEWYNSEEGQNEQASFLEWLDMNYPELLDKESIAEHIEPQWWDRKDEPHSGVPIGNMPIDGDPFGRWSDFEIRDNKVWRFPNFHKGNKGEDGYTVWYLNGNVAEEQIGKKRISYSEDGTVKDFYDDEDNMGFSVDKYGDIAVIKWMDGDTGEKISAYKNRENRNRTIQGELASAHLDETNGDLDIEDHTRKNGIRARYEKGKLVSADELPSWRDLDTTDLAVQKRAQISRDAAMRTFAKADALIPKAKQLAERYSRRHLDPRGRAQLGKFLKDGK